MNGRAHLVGNLIVGAVGLAVTATQAPDALPGVALGLTLGIIANPDVRDQEHKRNVGEHVVDSLAGKAVGRLWTAYWWPLAKMIPHRHEMSHMPFVGTLIGLLWLFVPALVAWWLYLGHQGSPTAFVMAVLLKPWVKHCYIGWVAQDITHWIQDHL